MSASMIGSSNDCLTCSKAFSNLRWVVFHCATEHGLFERVAPRQVLLKLAAMDTPREVRAKRLAMMANEVRGSDSVNATINLLRPDNL